MNSKPSYEELKNRISKLEKKIEDFKSIEWLLEKNQDRERTEDQYSPPYGDVTELNTCRLILDSVGKATLKRIAEDAIDLLETSVAVYEQNGDYAFGMFSSGWCRFMDSSSRRLCRTNDNREAIACGKWLCHENCWNDSAKPAMEAGTSIDIPCIGGIRLYAEPIFAEGRAIGAINIGYGNPPTDPETLEKLASRFEVPAGTLKEKALAYRPRPQFIIEIAKKRLSALAEIIGEIVERKQLERRLEEERKQYDTILSALDTGLSLINPDMTISWANEKTRSMFPGKEPVGSACHYYFESSSKPCSNCPVPDSFETGGIFSADRFNENTGKWYHIISQPIKDSSGSVSNVLESLTDITDIKAKEEHIRRINRVYAVLSSINQAIVRIKDPRKIFREACRAAVEEGGLAAALLAEKSPETGGIHIEASEGADAGFLGEISFSLETDSPAEFPAKKALEEGRHALIDSIDSCPPGTAWRDEALKRGYRSAAAFPVSSGGETRGVFHLYSSEEGFFDQDEVKLLDELAMDISHSLEIRDQEERQKHLEDQLNHAQRMEAVGRLAGGVAHDFNNLVSIIMGYSEIILENMHEQNPHREMLEHVYSAGEKARSLTRQLLAFSRRQILEIKTLDVNSVVTEFEKLLQRVIGEDIILEIFTRQEPLYVKADSSQIEQVLMNLAVNARDAMPYGGKLTIETDFTELDNEYASGKPGVKPGKYALIAVSDNGAGMDRSTCGKIFEPFFTTKGKEKGTGLGLATSYGIVKQHGGNIWAYSEQGRGTTFKIYLPAAAASEQQEKIPDSSEEGAEAGSAVVLVAEDDPAVRQLASEILRRSGCTVMAPENEEKIIELAENHQGPIHLLLADVIMPEMKGPEIYRKVAEQHPETKVLYMSGYTDNIIAHHGILEEGVNFIQKPFSAKTLAARVKDAIAKKQEGEPNKKFF